MMIAAPSLFSRISIKALVLGVIIDFVGTKAFFICLMFTIRLLIAIQDPVVALTANVAELTGNSSFVTMLFFIGFSFTFAGGYTTALLAQKAWFLNSTILGFIMTIFSLSSIRQSPPFIYLIPSLTLTVPCAILGGFTARFFNKINK